MKKLIPILATLACAPALANITATVVSGCGAASAVKNPVTNKWEVTLVVTSNSCPTEFSVQGTSGSSNEPIQWIRVYNPHAHSTAILNIGTLATITRIGDIEEIRGHDGGNPGA